MVYFFVLLVVLLVSPALVSPIRQVILTGPLFHYLRKRSPKISTIERQAIEAGSDGFDREFFSGNPDWDKFRAIPPVQLTKEEQTFLDGPTKEFCASINDWEIRGVKREVPDEVWNFAKKHGFLGLRVSKEAGGHGFSAQAKSIILGMIASRSVDASTTVAVPNSLGPDELLEQYGTEEQKKKYLKALVSGDEIASFAITSQNAGSDAGSMRDVGYVTHVNINGEKTLGIKISWSKRYITLTSRATVLVLAFRLFDPEKLLEGAEDRGITLALIPAKHPGVKIGRRHLPGGSAFPNGPTWGEDVCIPLEWVIGGKDGIGQGWKMVMQCLAAGRGISLPSMSAATVKLILRVSSAYARIRRQFNKPIGHIEGVQEPLARLVEAAYVTESARGVTAAMIDRDTRPLVLASILKYQTTEYARRAVHDAMDIHGGKGIIDGPSNYLQSAYQIAPVAITVEGANIITRSLMVIGQAVLRSHPYFRVELESFEQTEDARKALKMFDRALTGHVVHLASNLLLSVAHNLTHGTFVKTYNSPKHTKQWYRKLSHASRRFALLADIVILAYQGTLKKKQYIGGRLADVLSELYLMACVLKRFEDEGAHTGDYPIVEFCVRNGLYRFESSVAGLIDNMHSIPLRIATRFIVGSWVLAKRPSSDRLKEKVALAVLEPGEVRDRLTRYVYIPKSEEDPVKLLEQALQESVATEDILVRVERAIRTGEIKRYLDTDWIKAAIERNIISNKEGRRLQKTDALVQKVIAVDHFDPTDIRGIKPQ